MKLDFLDGIRGIAALYVAGFHATRFTGDGAVHWTSPLAKAVGGALSLGYYSVAVFIVLSGFCLGIPVAKSAQRDLPGGFGRYLMRRAKRILPPYYAALLLFALLIWTVPLLAVPHGTEWDSKIPLTLPSLFAHLLLIHNVHADWVYRIDGPLWSVATEWQIYFLYPFLLIPVWKRAGLAMAVTVGLAVGAALALLGAGKLDLGLAHPWYLGLFALGMSGAALVFSADQTASRLRNWLSESYFTCFAVGLCLVLLAVIRLTDLPAKLPLSEILAGVATTAVITHLALREAEGRPASWLLRQLQSPPTLWLGLFSYSVYLIHSPLLAWFNLATLDLALSPDQRLALMLLIAMPLAVMASYVFHLLVERRFLSGHQATRVEPVAAAEAPGVEASRIR